MLSLPAASHFTLSLRRSLCLTLHLLSPNRPPSPAALSLSSSIPPSRPPSTLAAPDRPAFDAAEDGQDGGPSSDDEALSEFGNVHVIIPDRLGFVLHEDEAQTKEQVHHPQLPNRYLEVLSARRSANVGGGAEDGCKWLNDGRR